MTLHDFIQTIPCTLRHIRQPFATRHADLGGLAAPPHQELGVGFLDLIERQTFKMAVMELPHIFFDEHRQIVRLANILGGLQGAAKVTRIDRVNFLGTQPRSKLLGLTNADFTQVPITGALTTSLEIPIGGPMPH